MSSKRFFIEESAPEGLEKLVDKAYLVLDVPEKDLSHLFPEALVEDTFREVWNGKSSFIACRFQKPGNLPPEAFTLASLLSVPPAQVSLDRILIWKNSKPTDENLNWLSVLWREPAIEGVKVLPLQEYLDSNVKQTLEKKIESSWELISQPEEVGLEFSEEEKAVLLNAAKDQGRAWRRVEWELFAQTWSEHCKHKIFSARILQQDEKNHQTEELTKGLFSQLIRGSTKKISDQLEERLRPWSCFHDNAGVIPLRDQNGKTGEFGLAVKMETHNSPTAISPYGGSSTGVLGVHRDILGTGLGAKPLASWDVLCMETPNSIHPRPQGALPADVIRKGVLRGIQDAGNQSGIPTVCGSVVFDESFAVKPYVFAGCVGLIEKKNIQKKCEAGQSIYCIGGATGADGIRGAVFSSRDLREEDFHGSVVQVANPFIQRKVTDFLMEALRRGLIQGITDNGAGGLACSVGEIAQSTGGAEIDISHLRLKHLRLEEWEKLLSESQERMTVVTASPQDFENLANEFAVGWDRLGALNQSGRFIVHSQGKELVNVTLKLLHDSCPKMELTTSWNLEKEKRTLNQSIPTKSFSNAVLSEEMILRFLESPHVCSREGIVRRFDHEVQGRTLRRPFEGESQRTPQEATQMEVPEAQSTYVIAHGLAPQRKDIFENVLFSFDEAYRKAILLGAWEEGMGSLDNFAWPDPLEANENGQRRLWRIYKATQILCRLCEEFKVPLISGKDSMKNNSKDFAALETLVVSIVGSTCQDWGLPSHFLRANDVVYVWKPLGQSLVDSAFQRVLGISDENRDFYFQDSVDEVILKMKDRYSILRLLQKKKLLHSAKSIGEGGLFLAAFEASLGNSINLQWLDENCELNRECFAEGICGFLLSCDPRNAREVESHCPELQRIGVLKSSVSDMKWQQRVNSYLKPSQEGFWR